MSLYKNISDAKGCLIEFNDGSELTVSAKGDGFSAYWSERAIGEHNQQAPVEKYKQLIFQGKTAKIAIEAALFEKEQEIGR